MLRSERHEKILQYLACNPYLEIAEAIRFLGASPATVTRDFNELAEKNLVERVRGGVRPAKMGIDNLPPFALRQEQLSSEKAALAREATKLIKPNDVIFIDGGTTTFHMGMCLPDIPMHIITNSLRLAAFLEERMGENSSLEISMTGGYLYKRSAVLLGPNTEASLKLYHANLAFLSAGGIDETGIYNTNELVRETERVMISNAETTVILADHSKIGRQATCRVCEPEAVSTLITNEWPASNPTVESLRKLGLEIITV